MKPTKPYLQSLLFTSLIICSISCFVFLSAVQNEQLNNAKNISTQEQVDEVFLPDVFAIKNLIEKVLENLPAS